MAIFFGLFLVFLVLSDLLKASKPMKTFYLPLLNMGPSHHTCGVNIFKGVPTVAMATEPRDSCSVLDARACGGEKVSFRC